MKYINKLIIRLILAFIMVLIGSNFVYFLLFKPTFYSSYLLLLPYKPIIENNSLIIQNTKLEFVSACIATSAYLLLALLILLTKDINLKKGMKILITGVIILLIVNLLRIYILALILLKFGIDAFNNVHLFFWQILSTVFVFLLWIFLTKYFKIKNIPIYSDFNQLIKILK